MSKARIPYFDFYPTDFMHGVRGLTAQEVGIYTMLLCRIYEENGPVEYHAARMSTYCGTGQATFEKVFARLVDLGKLDLSDGMVSNARSLKEIASRETRLKSNSQAGKISAEKRQQKQRQAATNAQQTFNHTDTDTDIDTEANASDADASPDEPDFRDEIWARGVAYLQRKGIAERNARTVIGKWIKDHGEASVFSAFEAASRERPVEPVAWITARLGSPPKQAVDMDEIWRTVAEGMRQ